MLKPQISSRGLLLRLTILNYFSNTTAKMRVSVLIVAIFSTVALAQNQCNSFNDCPGDQVCGLHCAFGPGEGAGSNICTEPCSDLCKFNCLCDGKLSYIPEPITAAIQRAWLT